MSTRTAVVLCNLGGPDRPESVEIFLRNLFSDPDIFRLPLAWLTQKPFAWYVARKRRHEATSGYLAIGGASPLLAETQKQALALKATLPAGLEVMIAMRYFRPDTREVVARLRQGAYERVVLLPLYPQYSHTTSGSSAREFDRECQRQHYHPDVRSVGDWSLAPDYLAGIAETIEAERLKLRAPDPADFTLLFSAHGLPEYMAAKDPYPAAVRATFEALRARLGWPHTRLVFQSRVGPLPWLRPYTDEAIREEAARGTRALLVYPIAFVSDHIETLFELGMTYRDLAAQVGITDYRVVPALNDHPRLIAALRTLTLEALRP